MPDNFWSNKNVEPKRNFRFLFNISKFPNVEWIVKTVEKPKYNISNIPHKFINHTFNYPGRVVWNPIAVTLVDPVQPVDASNTLNKFLLASGYRMPWGNADKSMKSASYSLEKKDSVNSLGEVTLTQLGAREAPASNKVSIADQWKLYNAYITGDVNFGTLSYGDEELTTLSFTLQYDWAYMARSGGGPEQNMDQWLTLAESFAEKLLGLA